MKHGENRWNSLRRDLNEIHDELSKKPDEEKMGYNSSIGGILNAYREADLSFNDAIKALSELHTKPSPNLSTRFGDDPEILQKVQHIRDYYDGKDVPEYEFWDDKYIPSDLRKSCIGNLIGISPIRCDHGATWENCRLKQPEQPKQFDTKLGQLTDEDARKGNPMGGRVWVVDQSKKTLIDKPQMLLMIHGIAANLFGCDHVTRTGLVKYLRLATENQLSAAGIDPQEAGVKQ